MNFFKKLFSKSTEEVKEDSPIKMENSPLDDSFVTHFTNKNGKFLYATHQEEINQFLANILEENTWEETLCFNNDLDKLLLVTGALSTNKIKKDLPFFTTCESLIASDGSILFTSNQLGETKLNDLPINFIVFAKTSQLVKNKDEALICINNIYKKEKPTNISAIKCYDPNKKETNDFMDYGNNNSKNLYLLLLEDL